jgi:hypothetical protein
MSKEIQEKRIEALRKSKEIADLRQKLLFDCEKAKFLLEDDLQKRLQKARFEINAILDEQHKRTLQPSGMGLNERKNSKD